MQIAILQYLPKHPRNPVKTDRFAQFQNICGMLENENYLAAHAACHATMNRIPRVLAADANIADIDDLKRAFALLLSHDTFDALIIPGLTDTVIQDQLCDFCRPYIAETPFKIFLDVPQNASLDDIVKRQSLLPRFASCCWPYIDTVTPGRRSSDALPASCLVAPLVFATAPYLRGVHEPPTLSDDDACYLDENGVCVLCTKIVAHRRVVGIRSPMTPIQTDTNIDFVDILRPNPNDEHIADPQETAFERTLMTILNERCADVLKTHTRNNRDLWAALARTVTAVLMHEKSSGHIKNYRVRCDEETASWGERNAPVVEIIIEYPKRVRCVKFNVEAK